MALILISPGNSFYNSTNTKNAISFAKNSFQKYLFFVPEILSIHGYLALGYNYENAVKSSDKKCKILKKYCS